MPPFPPENLATLAAAGRRQLETAGFDSETAVRDAVLLARSVLGWETADWLIGSSDPPPARFPDRFFALVDRRAAHEPMAYLTGEREFYGRVFKVSRDVLIPRPETEFVVEEALRCLSSRAPLIVDVGTGSGCLAVSLAIERPDVRVTATDISAAAMQVAKENAQRLGAASRIEFREGPFLAGVTEPIDLVVSNPPYIADAERAALPADVAQFEPGAALFGGGADGLDMIRALIPIAASSLAPGGSLVMEIGFGQIDAVRDLIEQARGLTFVRARADLQGIPRVIVATRS